MRSIVAFCAIAVGHAFVVSRPPAVIRENAISSTPTALFVFGGVGKKQKGGREDSSKLGIFSTDRIIPEPDVQAAARRAAEDSPQQNEIAASLGRIFRSIGSGIAQKARGVADAAVSRVKAVPGKVQQAIKNKADETAVAIKAAPAKMAEWVQRAATDAATKTQEAAVEYAAKAVDAIRAAPGKIVKGIQNAATDAASRAAKTIERKVDETVSEIKATPKRVAEGTKQAAEETVEKVQKTVEELITLPAKKFDELFGKGSKPSTSQSKENS